MAKPTFIVSPPAQKEFRVLGGTRPSGANAIARAALEAAHARTLAEQARATTKKIKADT